MKSSDLDIAILRTDRVLPQFVGDHGDYPEMFARLIREAGRAEQPPVAVRFTSYDVRCSDCPAPDAHPAYLITGSRHSVYDDEPWIAELAAFLQRVLEAGGRIVGICFGHQLMAHFFGGETAPAPGGWAVGVQEGRILRREPWMDSGSDRLNLIASHKDQVTRLPDGARLFAGSDFCPVGGFVMGDRVLTLQGHPEFRREYSRDLMEMRRDILGEAVFRNGVASLAKETDEMRAAGWIVRFLLQQGEAAHPGGAPEKRVKTT